MIKRARLWMISCEPAGNVWRVSSGGRSIHIAAKERKELYKNGIDKRINKLADHYGATALASYMHGKTVVDIGANCGEFALWALKNQAARILAFEPDPVAFEALTRNAAGTSITCYNIALWNKEGEFPLYVDTEGASTSLIGRGQAETVLARRLDCVLDELGIHDVFFLKADCEGGEPEMLDGAVETLRRTTHVAIDYGPERMGEETGEACAERLKGFDVRYSTGKRRIIFGINKAKSRALDATS